MTTTPTTDERVLIWTGDVVLDAVLAFPRDATGVVLVADLGGTAAQESYRALAAGLRQRGLATLLADLLTPEEQQLDLRTGHYRIDLAFLVERVRGVLRWLGKAAATSGLPVGFAGTGVAASAGAAVAADGAPLFALLLSQPRADLLHTVTSLSGVPVLVIRDGEQPEHGSEGSVDWLTAHAPVTA